MTTRAPVLLLFLALAACVGRPPERPHAPMLQSPVELHVLLPLSGDLAPNGAIQRDVVARAVVALNESRAPADRPLQAVLHDCGSTHDDAAATAAALIRTGVSAFIGPADPTTAFGLAEHLDRTDTLVVLPDAGEFPFDIGGPSTVAMLPPTALRGHVLLTAALRKEPTAATVALVRTPGTQSEGAAEVALSTAVARGLVPTLEDEADVRILQADTPPPSDVQVRVGSHTLTIPELSPKWRDPALPMDAYWARDERATGATYDAVVGLGRVLRRQPRADADSLRRALLDDSWEGVFGAVRFASAGPSGAAFAHPPEAR